MRLFTLCSYLITKESYDWWITRRKWGFKHQIFEEKKSKSVSRKYLEALRRILRACKIGCEISQAEGLHFAAKG